MRAAGLALSERTAAFLAKLGKLETVERRPETQLTSWSQTNECAEIDG